MTTTQRASAGTLLGGRYRLIEPVPGAGRAWRAEDEIDGRALLAQAVELPDGLPEAERQQARQRALRDAAVVARVKHPGIAQVVDAVVEDGSAWVISVRPPGPSLGEIVGRDGPVSPVAAALVGMQVLDALVAAGVPHGELTPYDVVIADNGRVRLTGFATTPLGAVGTRGFGAPEGGPGPAADLWALGVTLHVAVEGRMPNGARSRAGALDPALDALLERDLDRRTDLDTIRRLLIDAAGEPDAPAPPAPNLHDPEVVAALAAFDVALGAGSGPDGGSGAQVPDSADAAPRTSAAGPVPVLSADAPRSDAAAPATVSGTAAVAAAPTTNGRPVALQAIPWTAPAGRQQRPEPPAPATPEQAPRPAAPDRQTPPPRPAIQETATSAESPQPAVREPPGGAARTEPGRNRRRLLLGVAVAAVLAVVAALLLFLLNRDDDAPAAQPTAVSPASASAPEPTDAAPSPDTPIPPPAGWQLYRDPAGWSIAAPVGWTVARRGTSVTFTKADRTLRVTERADPPKDTYDAAVKLQPVIEAATPGYDFLRIANVSYRAWPTTDYEFRAGTATRTHSLFRSTVPSPQQVFDISWTCLDREWKADRAIFDTAMQTFDPGA
jgi:eukaryotic-like serine/threonine-protein kinase